ncbi:RsmE family RNA methyltransferase [Candidatus Babeliales bacterium]|nr:RsmE family RNA methyltransferase [Candidatus Babeliales bacterium]
MSKHLFAIYFENLDSLLSNKRESESVCFDDASLKNRITKILRIKRDEEFILFDEIIHARFLLKTTEQKKKAFCAELLNKKENLAIEPSITLYLPILKKEAFEYAIYVAAQMGVTTITPVITEKSAKTLPSLERLQKIMIAACEQSKSFVIPKLEQPQEFITAIKFGVGSHPALPRLLRAGSRKICFDENGATAQKLVNKLANNHDGNLIITLGPEGGFSENEKKALETAGFSFYRLTSTVLRSREAVTVGLGIVRSFGFI